jgi:hypothetical protein
LQNTHPPRNNESVDQHGASGDEQEKMLMLLS